MPPSFTYIDGGFKVGKLHLGNNLRKLRFHRDEITQEQLADKVGVTRQTIIAIEAARYAPSLELAFRIAHVLGVPLSEAFSYDATQDSMFVNKKP